MSDRVTKMVELSSVKGDIANLILSMIGADKQRSLDSVMFENENPNYGYTKNGEKLDYIHALEDFNKSYTNTDDNEYVFDTGLSTFYISRMVLSILLTLNKYVQNVSYTKSDDFKFGKPKSNQIVNPYSQHYSSTLFQILKNGHFQLVQKIDDTKNEVTFFTNSQTKNLIGYKRVNDLLNDDILFDTTNKEGFANYDPTNVINSNLRTSETNFLENMRKIILNFYTWYGMDKVAHLEKMLNLTNTQCDNTLDLTLQISLQRILTEFTTTITNNEANPNKYLPLSELYEDIIEQLAIINGANSSIRTDIYMFDCENEKNKLNLYAAVEEDLHMVNIEGTAIHSILELINRMIDERTKSKDYWTEEQIRSNINDVVGMLSNLFGQVKDGIFVKDTSNYDDTDLIKYDYNGTCCGDSVVELLYEFRNLYDDVLGYLNDETIEDDGDFSSTELDKVKLIGILKNLKTKTDTIDKFIYLPKSKSPDLFRSCHFSKIQINGSDDIIKYAPYYESSTEDFITNRTKYLDQFDKYGSPEHCRNFVALVLKLLFVIGDLYIIRTIQHIHADGSAYSLMMRSPNYKEELLNRKPPIDSYSLTDIIRIQSMRKNLENKNNKLKTRNIFIATDLSASYINANFNDKKEYSELTKDIIEQINIMIYYFGIDNSSDKQNTTYNKLEISDNIECCYPIMRTIMYYFDNFFNNKTNTNAIDINESNNLNNGTYNCFEILTNYLTYTAMAIINDRGYAQENKKDNIFKLDDFELSCMDLTYLFNTITTNWSDKDDSGLNTITLNNPTWEFSSLYPYLEDDEQDSHLSAILRDIDTLQLRITNNVDSNDTFDVLVVKSIKNTMVKMINSDNLSSFVKFVYWITLYVINGICIHFIKGNYNKMVKYIKNN